MKDNVISMPECAEPEAELKTMAGGIKNGARLTLAILAVNFLIFVANLYLSNGYVSRMTYDGDMKDNMQRRETLTLNLGNIAVELRGIKDHMEGDAEQNRRIQKLEDQVLELEKVKR